MSKSLFVIITAGGRGSRMGGEVPKQFLYLDGKPILRRTIETFARALPGARIVVVLPADQMSFWRDYCDKANFNCPQTVVEGGITRFHSVRAALAKVPDGAVVAIHDGVRPFVSEGLIRRMAEEMEEHRALIPVLPVTDTLTALEALSDGSWAPSPGPSPDRSRIFAVQTPQMFRSEDIKEAYRQAYDTSFTDDGSVARQKGIPLSYTMGERYNIKITTPEDLPLAEFILSQEPR